MPGWITFNKDPIDLIGERIKTRIPFAVRAVLRELVWSARYEDGLFDGVQMSRGDVCMSVEALCERLNLTPRTCRSALQALKSAAFICAKATNQATNRAQFYHIEIYDDIVIPETNRQTSRQVSDKQPTTYNRSKEVKEELQDQIQDQKRTAPAVLDNPVSDLGNLVVEMGLPAVPATYSWVGGLRKRFGEDVCRTFIEDQRLKGATRDDFKDGAKGMKAYFTAAITKRADGNGKAEAVAAMPQYKISTVSGMPVANLKRRENQIREWIRDYEEYYNLQEDPDKGKPGVEVFVSDERVREIWGEATKEREERERLGREEGQRIMEKLNL